MKLPVTRFERCWAVALAAWCWVARNFAGAFCRGSCDVKEEERVATMMVLTSPIGIPVSIIFFSCLICLQVLEFVLKVAVKFLVFKPIVPMWLFLVVIAINPTLRQKWQGGFRGWLGLSQQEWKTYISEKLFFIDLSLNKEENDPVIWNHLFSKCIKLSDEENQVQPTTSLKWSHVRDILTGKQNLYLGRDLDDVGLLGEIQLLCLTFFQRTYLAIASFLSSLKLCFANEYPIEEGMTKYIFVDFNVSIVIVYV